MPVRYIPVQRRCVTAASTAYNDGDSIAGTVGDLRADPLVERVIEWLCVIGVFVGIGVVPVLAVALDDRPTRAAGSDGLDRITDPSLARSRRAATSTTAMSRTAIASRIAHAAKPVISGEMVLLIRAGRPVMWEPAIVAELSHAGLYDEAAFARLVRDHRSAFSSPLATATITSMTNATTRRRCHRRRLYPPRQTAAADVPSAALPVPTSRLGTLVWIV